MKYFPLTALIALTSLAVTPAQAADIEKGTFAIGGDSNFALDTVTINPGDDDELEISTTTVNLSGRY